MSVNLLVPSNSNIGGRLPLAFYDSELPGGAANSVIHLLVRVDTDVRHVLVDIGASCDIMYTSLFKTLQLTKKNISPYVGSEFYGFNVRLHNLGATFNYWSPLARWRPGRQ